MNVSEDVVMISGQWGDVTGCGDGSVHEGREGCAAESVISINGIGRASSRSCEGCVGGRTFPGAVAV